MEALADWLASRGEPVEAYSGKDAWNAEQYRARASTYDAQPLLLKVSGISGWACRWLCGSADFRVLGHDGW